MKIITIVGARPQFIKAAAISRLIRNLENPAFQEILLHTGQHYDENMSKIFFDELQIPDPKYNLKISGAGHGATTGRMMEGIEKILIEERPDWVLVYGDTNSTLAGALAAAKLHIKVAHVEAGLRSFNMRMPEEINRILSDRLSTLLFCPTATAVHNLKNEGVEAGVHNVGDVMYDVAMFYKKQAGEDTQIFKRLGIEQGSYVLATCHRAENTDDISRMTEILNGLKKISENYQVIFPLHPRTRKVLNDFGLNNLLIPLTVVEPLSFLDMVALESAARFIVTDSGGVQKEAFFYGVPCITIRDETEWVETVETGWNVIAGASAVEIVSATAKHKLTSDFKNPYGDGNAAKKIIELLGAHR